MGWDISQTTRNARAPGGANKYWGKNSTCAIILVPTPVESIVKAHA